jgi:hypothetical protein
MQDKDIQEIKKEFEYSVTCGEILDIEGNDITDKMYSFMQNLIIQSRNAVIDVDKIKDKTYLLGRKEAEEDFINNSPFMREERYQRIRKAIIDEVLETLRSCIVDCIDGNTTEFGRGFYKGEEQLELAISKIKTLKTIEPVERKSEQTRSTEKEQNDQN